jgi:ABC-2 type transport system ATP-binding protein
MNDQSGSSILQVEKLSVSYGTFKAVSEISFDVSAGEIFGLHGPNCAGKTSTLSAVAGLLD